jgi:Transposase IS200 like
METCVLVDIVFFCGMLMGVRDEIPAPGVHRRPPPPAGAVPPDGGAVRLVDSLNGISSGRLRQEFPDLARHYRRSKRLWSGSYVAGSGGGAPLDVLRIHIAQQRRPG